MNEKSKKKLKLFIGVIFLILFVGPFTFSYIQKSGLDNDGKTDNFSNKETADDLSTSLSEKWNAIWGTNDFDRSKSLVQDSEGNIYVAGTVNNPYDLGLVKFDEYGNKIWNSAFNGPEDGSDTGNDVALGPNEKFVYLVGYLDQSGGNYDMVLIQYNATDGTEIWNKTWTDSTSYTMGDSVVVNSSGYVFMGGHENWNRENLYIIIYNESGTYIKNETIKFSEKNSFSDMTIDSNDNIYVTGSNRTNDLPRSDTFIIKFDSFLNQEWNKTFSGKKMNYNYSSSSAITCDSENNIYITGELRNSSFLNTYWHLIKYDSSGNHIFNNTIIRAPFDDYYSARDICVDNNGNSYLIGAANGSTIIDYYDFLIVKCDQEGNYDYNWTWDGGNRERGAGLFFNPEGYILACGRKNATATDPDNFDIVVVNFSLVPRPFNLEIEGISPEPYDADGSIILNWSDRAPFDADNYTVYNSTSYISEINGSLDKNVEEITDTTFEIDGLVDGTYYYIIEAHNAFGNSTSDCKEVTIGRTPEDFIVGEDSTRPHDSDGVFWLNWSESSHAETYAIYYDSSEISDFNSANLYQKGISTNQIQIDMSSIGNGLWYFTVVANNTFEGGYTETQAQNNVNISVGISPATFTLSSSDAGDPNLDGLFLLNWTESTYADNYSLYWSLEEISDVSSPNVTLLYNGTELSYFIDEPLGDDDLIYYFKVLSENQFGTNESNAFNVTVGYPGVEPTSFTLSSSDAGDPDLDGLFLLNWTESTYADNYSLYWSLEEISDVSSPNVTLLYNGTELSYFIDEPLGDDDLIYYFKVLSENQFGTNESNAFNVTVGYPGVEPTSFTLSSSDAGDPDLDGQFTLTWTVSNYADNYSVYMSTSQITDINDPSVNLLYNGTEQTFEITEANGLMDDIYYFKVISKNQFGSNETNTFSITVGNPGGSGTDPFPWWLQAIFTGLISATVGLVIKVSYSRYKKRKELMEKISEQLDKVDNIEQFLKDKLGYEEWQRLQEPLNQYQKRAIDQKDLIKKAKKELGDRFMELFKAK